MRNLFLPTHESQQKIGIILSSSNDCFKKPVDSYVWEKATASDGLFENDTLFTGEATDVQVTLEKDVKLNLASHTLITFNYKYDKLNIELNSGAMGLEVKGTNPQTSTKNGSQTTDHQSKDIRINFDDEGFELVHKSNKTAGFKLSLVKESQDSTVIVPDQGQFEIRKGATIKTLEAGAKPIRIIALTNNKEVHNLAPVKVIMHPEQLSPKPAESQTNKSDELNTNLNRISRPMPIEIEDFDTGKLDLNNGVKEIPVVTSSIKPLAKTKFMPTSAPTVLPKTQEVRVREVLPTPEFIQPDEGLTLVSDGQKEIRLVVEINAVPTAKTYQLQMSSSSEFKNIIIDRKFESASFVIKVPLKDQSSSMLYLRIKVENEKMQSEWTKPRSLKIKSMN
ncbi:MAG: hypothetical protein ACXVCP_11325 [Bdellovibrio sp.]